MSRSQSRSSDRFVQCDTLLVTQLLLLGSFRSRTTVIVTACHSSQPDLASAGSLSSSSADEVEYDTSATRYDDSTVVYQRILMALSSTNKLRSGSDA